MPSNLFLFSRIVFRMILKGKFSISLFDLIIRGISWDTKNFVVISLSIRIVLVEKLLFVLVLHSMLLEKSLECSISIIICVWSMSHFIIMRSSILVRKDLISLANVMEFSFSLSPISFMFIWMPLT